MTYWQWRNAVDTIMAFSTGLLYVATEGRRMTLFGGTFKAGQLRAANNNHPDN